MFLKFHMTQLYLEIYKEEWNNICILFLMGFFALANRRLAFYSILSEVLVPVFQLAGLILEDLIYNIHSLL